MLSFKKFPIVIVTLGLLIITSPDVLAGGGGPPARNSTALVNATMATSLVKPAGNSQATKWHNTTAGFSTGLNETGVVYRNPPSKSSLDAPRGYGKKTKAGRTGKGSFIRSSHTLRQPAPPTTKQSKKTAVATLCGRKADSKQGPDRSDIRIATPHTLPASQAEKRVGKKASAPYTTRSSARHIEHVAPKVRKGKGHSKITLKHDRGVTDIIHDGLEEWMFGLEQDNPDTQLEYMIETASRQEHFDQQQQPERTWIERTSDAAVTTMMGVMSLSNMPPAVKAVGLTVGMISLSGRAVGQENDDTTQRVFDFGNGSGSGDGSGSGSLFANGTNLPIFLIHTNGNPIINDPKITASLDVINNDGVNFPEDLATGYSGYSGIELRGQSSITFPKKSYTLETRTASGANNNVELLGFPKENDWVLHGPFFDQSLMRNHLAYTVAGEMRDKNFSPRSMLIELFLNDRNEGYRYEGVYLLVEKIKRDKNRVDINKLKTDENEGENLTGGYILEISSRPLGRDTGWESTYCPLSHYSNFINGYPDGDDITPQQMEYIRDYITDFERALISGDNYKQYIEIDSFVDYFLHAELFGNSDAYEHSTFLHKDKEGSLVMGPVWDFDRSMGNELKTPDQGWQHQVTKPIWWDRLIRDSEFIEKVQMRWFELRTSLFSLNSLTTRIDENIQLLEEYSAADRNNERWPVRGTDYFHWFPGRYATVPFTTETYRMKHWFSQRLMWLDSAIRAMQANESYIPCKLETTTSVTIQATPKVTPEATPPNKGATTKAFGVISTTLMSIIISRYI